MNGYGIGKREIYERIYIAIVALVILLCFLPCYELKEVRDGIPKITSSTLLDSKTNVLPLLIPPLIIFFVFKGMRIGASVFGIIESLLNVVLIWFIVDDGQYRINVLSHPDTLFCRILISDGVTSITSSYPIGYYLNIGAAILLLIFAVTGFFIPEDGDKVLITTSQ